MLTEEIKRYLTIRNRMGFKLEAAKRQLQDFAQFASGRGDTHLIARTAVEWAGQVGSQSYRASRLKLLIRVARFLRAEDARHEVPPDDIFCHRFQRPIPYIFSQEEIQQVIREAARLGPPESLRPHTYSTLFGLVAVTGLRGSEALALRIDDLTADGLVIRETKFRKTRLVPLHESTCAELHRYLVRRCHLAVEDDHLFVSLRGRKLSHSVVHETFREVLRAAGIPREPHRPVPCLHHLRHTFAVRALQSCPGDRDNVTRHMLALTTYMGHARVDCTYWYLENTPELMTRIAHACESFVEGDAP